MVRAGKRLCVLVVDDDYDTADSLACLVRLWGYHAQVAYAALPPEEAAGDAPDVILLDIAMPKTDGACMARQLRQCEAFRDTLLIAVTGFDSPAHRLLCWEAGIDHYMVKPLDHNRLKVVLRAWALRAPALSVHATSA